VDGRGRTNKQKLQVQRLQGQDQTWLRKEEEADSVSRTYWTRQRIKEDIARETGRTQMVLNRQ
jgi:hypothetical protein